MDVPLKVGDKVYVKIHMSDYKTIVYEGEATLSLIDYDHHFEVKECDYAVFPLLGDTIRKITKLERALK